MLGRKQNIRNEDWIEAMAHIEETVSRDEIDSLADTTVGNIRETVDGKNAAYAWSGGKDSIVLGDLAEQAGIAKSMIGVCELEYPAFMAWIEAHRPQGCEIVNVGLGLDWLAAHEDMIFPDTAAKAARWFSIVQHKAQREYFRRESLDVILLGRRHADGNYTGPDGIYTDGKGVTRYSPLMNWTHEHVLAYIHYHALPLPPIYGWPNGYLCGTHPWPARQHTHGNGWQEVYDIDPSVVTAAAEKIDGARRFLEGGERA